MNASQSSLFAGVSYSYIIFIEEYIKLLNNSLYTSLEYLDNDVYYITKEMRTLYGSLPQLLDSEGEFKETYAHKLVEFRSVLENKYRSLNAYKRELSHLTSIYNLKTALDQEEFTESGLTLEDAKDLDYSSLANDCAEFVFKGTNRKQRQQKASLMLPYVPMRMTRDSFLSYITKSINCISINDTQEDVDFLTSILYQLLDGHFYEGFGKDFKDISESLHELATCEEEDFIELAELVDETLTTCLKVINSLYKMICTFSTLLIFDSMSFEVLCDLHISFYDLYCTVEKILNDDEDANLFLTSLPERIEEIKTGIKKSYEKAGHIKNIDPLFTLIQTYINMDLSYVFGFDSDEKPQNYSAETKSLLEVFIAHVKEYLDTLSPGHRKLRMQYFISILPFIMNKSTFYDYVLRGFSSTNPKRNLIAALYLSNILVENGHFESEETDSHIIEDPSSFEDAGNFFDNTHDFEDHDHHQCHCDESHSCDDHCHGDDHGDCNCGHPHE